MPRSSALDITRSLLDVASPVPAQGSSLTAAGGPVGAVVRAVDGKIKARVRALCGMRLSSQLMLTTCVNPSKNAYDNNLFAVTCFSEL